MAQRSEATEAGPRICIIRAGPSGIAASRNMLAAGFGDLTIFEKGDQVGGNWVFSAGPAHSSVYETTHAISSRKMSQYDGFPMPRDYPDYPSHDQLRRYFQAYAGHFGLTPLIRFRTEVTRAVPTAAGGWLVSTSGPAGEATERFDHLLVANGHHWDPRLPAYPGAFDGEFLHAHDYKTARPFAGKRVLVIGGGNTACDIAVETARVSVRTCISMRRGYHFFPKFIFGRPIDAMYGKGLFMPRPLRQQLARLLLWVVQGDNRRYGLPRPDHRPYEQHPIVNSELLYGIRHGRVQARPDVSRFDGGRVQFVDGQSEAFDVVIAATGYRTSFPFLNPSLVDLSQATELPLYLNVFHPAHRNLYFIGLVQPIGCIWPLADLQARIVAREIQGRWQRPADIAARIRRRIERPHYRWAPTFRHALEVDYHAYRKQLLGELARAA
jgi:hypothetical protein